MPSLAKMKRLIFKYDWLVGWFRLFLVVILLLAVGWLVWPGLKAAGNWLNPAFRLEGFRGRTNILLLGVGGDGHTGGDLTDTLMLLSIDLSGGDAVIISLPRDIWVESLQAKLNTAYHYGEAKQSGGGLVLAKAAVGEIINQPVHYALLVDFSGFERSVDVLGGIAVEVPRGFVDNRYPIPGREEAQSEAARYETIEFKAGKQQFDGATALKYVRSRQAEGEEGSDYARAQRQQRVVLAFKDKLLSAKTLFSYKKLKALKQLLAVSLKTDLRQDLYPDIFKLAVKIDRDQLRTAVLDQGSQSEDIPPLLYNPPVSRFGQWVLSPVGDDWKTVYQYVEEILYQNQSAKE